MNAAADFCERRQILGPKVIHRRECDKPFQFRVEFCDSHENALPFFLDREPSPLSGAFILVQELANIQLLAFDAPLHIFGSEFEIRILNSVSREEIVLIRDKEP